MFPIINFKPKKKKKKKKNKKTIGLPEKNIILLFAYLDIVVQI
jgi:hypothetical protein